MELPFANLSSFSNGTSAGNHKMLLSYHSNSAYNHLPIDLSGAWYLYNAESGQAYLGERCWTFTMVDE